MADSGLLSVTLRGSFVEEASLFEREVELHADGTKRGTERPVGLMLRSTEGRRRIVQLQIEGATFSRVAPYDRWEPFRDEAKQTWLAYATVAEPQVVTRVGVRYINKIEVGAGIDDLTPYLPGDAVEAGLATERLQSSVTLPDGGWHSSDPQRGDDP